MPYKQSWLDVEAALGYRPVLHGHPKELRKIYERLVAFITPRLPEPPGTVNTVDSAVGPVKFRIYTPKYPENDEPLPVCIWAHGGGYMQGDVEGDDPLVRVLVDALKIVFISVGYRLDPKFKLPTQINDTLSVYQWAFDNAIFFNGDKTRFFTAGGSAGGSLAFQVGIAVKRNPVLAGSLVGICALCPGTVHFDNVPEEYKPMYKAIIENATNVPIIDKESLETFYYYAGAHADDKIVFPLLDVEAHSLLPPTYFAACEFDPLRDDAYAMELALKKVGVTTKLDYYAGFPHLFWIFPTIPEGRGFVENVVGGIRWILGRQQIRL